MIKSIYQLIQIFTYENYHRNNVFAVILLSSDPDNPFETHVIAEHHSMRQLSRASKCIYLLLSALARGI